MVCLPKSQPAASWQLFHGRQSAHQDQSGLSIDEPIDLCSDDDGDVEEQDAPQKHGHAQQLNFSSGSGARIGLADVHVKQESCNHNNNVGLMRTVYGQLRVANAHTASTSATSSGSSDRRTGSLPSIAPPAWKSDAISDEDDGVDHTAEWHPDYWIGGDDEMICRYGFTSRPPRQASTAYSEWLQANKRAIAREHRANAAKRPTKPVTSAKLRLRKKHVVELRGSDRCRWCIRANVPCLYYPLRRSRQRVRVLCECCRSKGRTAYDCAVDPTKLGLTAAQVAEELKKRAERKAQMAKNARARALKERKLAAEQQALLGYVQRDASATPPVASEELTKNRLYENNEQQSTQRAKEAVTEHPSSVPTVPVWSTSPVLAEQSSYAVARPHVSLIDLLRTIGKIKLRDASKANVLSSLSAAEDGREVTFYIDLMEQAFRECGDLDGLIEAHAGLRAAKMYW